MLVVLQLPSHGTFCCITDALAHICASDEQWFQHKQMVTDICMLVVGCSGVCMGSAASVRQLELPRHIHIHSPVSTVGFVGIQRRAAQLACGRSDGHAGRYAFCLLQQMLAAIESSNIHIYRSACMYAQTLLHV